MEKNKKGLSAWQLTMMALGSVIGASFFLGTSVAMNAAGPSILISFVLAGVLVYVILYALSELTVANPEVGSFSTFASREIGTGAGFTVGWLYWTGTVLSMSSEAAAIALLLRQWFPDLSIGISGSVTIVGMTMVNLLGTNKIGKLETGLSAVKVFAIIFFILTALALIFGLFPGTGAVGTGELAREPLMPGGIKGIAGSLLLVVFAYAGFEVIGLAASEVANPVKTIPKAIKYTVISLVGLYILYAMVLMPLIPTGSLNENVSPMVSSLNRWGIGWAGTVINLILVSAILSAMLSAIFGLGRMIRSLEYEGQAPKWLRDDKDVPYRGILFSGVAMLAGLGFGLLFPRAYLVLTTTGGFTLLFTYGIILYCQIRFRKREGCPPDGICQMPGFPYASWIALISIAVILLSMPLIPGQGTGLVAGLAMVAFFVAVYYVIKLLNKHRRVERQSPRSLRGNLLAEASRELTGRIDDRQEKE